jgi:aerobic carbon-monoxide dehydrogenase small subunit
MLKLKINNTEHIISEAQSEENLLQFLREDLDLTGTKKGCGIGVCGSCTILANGNPVRACRKLVKDFIGQEILTIEGITEIGKKEYGGLHPLQQAFIDAGAIQCGFCTPGMVLSAYALLLKNPQPTREQIRKAIMPNLCRCTGYQQIVDAIEAASRGRISSARRGRIFSAHDVE